MQVSQFKFEVLLLGRSQHVLDEEMRIVVVLAPGLQSWGIAMTHRNTIAELVWDNTRAAQRERGAGGGQMGGGVWTCWLLSWKSDAKLGEAPPTPPAEAKLVVTAAALLLDFFFHGQLRRELSFSIIVEDDGLLLCGLCLLPPKENLQALFWAWWSSSSSHPSFLP